MSCVSRADVPAHPPDAVRRLSVDIATAISRAPEPVDGRSAVVDDRLHVLTTGYENNDRYSTLLRYDPAAGTWSTLPVEGERVGDRPLDGLTVDTRGDRRRRPGRPGDPSGHRAALPARTGPGGGGDTATTARPQNLGTGAVLRTN